MPGFDKTGPLGTGPIGRRLGPCSGGQALQGRGRGFRRGGGFRWQTTQSLLPAEEEIGLLESQLDAISRRLQELRKTKLSE
jgi:hypothetical protein